MYGPHAAAVAEKSDSFHGVREHITVHDTQGAQRQFGCGSQGVAVRGAVQRFGGCSEDVGVPKGARQAGHACGQLSSDPLPVPNRVPLKFTLARGNGNLLSHKAHERSEAAP